MANDTTIDSFDWMNAGIIDGRYQVVDKLGDGGMGSVYKALDTRLSLDVVLKTPRAELLRDHITIDRFSQEIRSLVALQHPHIVRILDAGQHEGMPYFISQFLSGGSLDIRLLSHESHRRSLFQITGLRKWLRDLANTLDFIHAHGYIHRDIKPANILFDGHGNVFITDFGISKALAGAGIRTSSNALKPSQTGQRGVIGSPTYIAPESVLEDSFTPRSDQYSLAVTLYEMFAGRAPFLGATSMEIICQKCTQPATGLDTLVPMLSPNIVTTIMRGLEMSPGRRHPNCRSLVDPIIEDSPSYKSVKTPKRNCDLRREFISLLPKEELFDRFTDQSAKWGATFLTDGTNVGTIRFIHRAGWIKSLLFGKEHFEIRVELQDEDLATRILVTATLANLQSQGLEVLERYRRKVFQLRELCEATDVTDTTDQASRVPNRTDNSGSATES